METNLFRTVQDVFVLLEDGNRQALMPVGLTPTQFNLLRSLKEGPAQGRTIGQIAQVLVCTRGNVTRLVRRLIASGLVRTSGDLQDGRVVLVTMTDAGASAYGDAERQLDLATQRRMSTLPREEADLLERLSALLLDALRCDLRDQAVEEPHRR